MLSTAYRYFRQRHIGSYRGSDKRCLTNGIGRLSAYSSSKKGAGIHGGSLSSLQNEEGTKVLFTDIRPRMDTHPLLRPQTEISDGDGSRLRSAADHKGYRATSESGGCRLAMEYSSRSLATRTEHGVDKSKDENLDSRHPAATTVFASLCLYGFRARGIAA